MAMKKTLACLASASFVAAQGDSPHARNYVEEFKSYMEQFEKKYENHEFRHRFDTFVENVQYIEKENAKGTNSYTLGINDFADMPADEFQMHYMGYKKPKTMFAGVPYLGPHKMSNMTLPASVDWRTKGAVTPVKNQKKCGSCWAFSSTGALEGANQIAGGKLVSLSEQQLVDCGKKFGELGCKGGSMDGAFQYIQKNGLDTEASYAYTATDGVCKAASGTSGICPGHVTGFHDVSSNDLHALMDAVAKGPVSIAIEADKLLFQLYRGGVFSKACGTQLDHGVLAIGYGTDTKSKDDYWLVKNSWGPTWGEHGYIRLLRGKGKGECGILMQPTYPAVSDKPCPSPGPSPPPAPPSPPTPPSPPSPGTSHYEKPPCQSDELALKVQGVEGVTCSPTCTSTPCPSDVPAGTTAKPRCMLSDKSSGAKYCALSCFFGGCPLGASCKHIGLAGLCMYPPSVSAAVELESDFGIGDLVV